MPEQPLDKENILLNEKIVLTASIFVAGLCSIIYELLISTVSSYFLGDSIKQFSITIGIYMAAMGLGSYLSRIFKEDLLLKFISVEIILGLIGGSSVPILYFVYAHTGYLEFNIVSILLIILIGTLTGLEIPLLARIMKHHYPLKINLSNVLSLDYLGALLATLLFPFILLPFFGTFKSSLIFGMINIGVGFLNLWYFSDLLNIKKKRVNFLAAVVVTLFFLGMLFFSQVLLDKWSDELYKDDIIFMEQTPYQNLVVTKGQDDVRLYINGVIQFSSRDEYRYHEPLVHIPMSLLKRKKKVLILGGGEGLTAREVLKHPDVELVRIIDLDAGVFRLAKENPHVKALNEGVMENPKLDAIANDAFVFLQENSELYDLIISDLPDPSNEAVARLYSREFFKLSKKRLAKDGLFITQASSPFHSKKAFWCIYESMKAGGYENVLPYHSYVPSFGDWGFIIGSSFPISKDQVSIDFETKCLTNEGLDRMFVFEKDIQKVEVNYNTIDQPTLLNYFLEDWYRWSKQVAPK